MLKTATIGSAAALGTLAAAAGFIRDDQPADARPQTFPQAWVGTYAGPLTVSRPGSAEPMRGDMTLDIQPIADRAGAYTWHITYGGQATRAYDLLPTEQPGRFVIDENNGIVLTQAAVGDVLYGAFTVGQSLLVGRIERTSADTIVYEISTWPTEPDATTGGEDTPQVTTRALRTVQRAELQRRD